MAYLSLKNVTKEYHSGEVTIKALSGVNLEIEEGELCVIVGPSGAGKTTLLNILGGIDVYKRQGRPFSHAVRRIDIAL